MSPLRGGVDPSAEEKVEEVVQVDEISSEKPELASEPASGDRLQEGEAEEEDDSDEKDFWSFNGDCLICHHRSPRNKTFVQTESNCPLPLKYLDVTRSTHTDIEDDTEHQFDDIWTRVGEKALSDFLARQDLVYGSSSSSSSWLSMGNGPMY